jgi:hypothetical protein
MAAGCSVLPFIMMMYRVVRIDSRAITLGTRAKGEEFGFASRVCAALATTTSEIDQEILSFPFVKYAFIIIIAIEAMHRLANAAKRKYM